jgi:3-methyl-2-oxobutanoate hydroxymethyltransferase
MPFLSYQVSDEKAVENAGRFLKEANVDAIKLEGGTRVAGRIRAIVEAGILVVGHIGLIPPTARTCAKAPSTGRSSATG